MQESVDTAHTRQEGPNEIELMLYDKSVSTLRLLNLRASGDKNIMEPGYPRQCYMPMPPVPGMPVLPEGVYPVDYNDLCNLSETRANILMASFNLAGPGNENMNANMIEKIFMIAVFMGVCMKEEFREEYDKWEMMKEMEHVAIGEE